MGNNDKIKAWIASDRMRLLETIEPFPAIIDALDEAVECFAYTWVHSNSNPMIVFYGKETGVDNEFEFLPFCLPRIYLELLVQKPSKFMMRIDFPEGDGYCVVKEHMEAFISSVFSCYFSPSFYAGMQCLTVSFEAEVLTLARLITHFLKLMNLQEPEDVSVNKCMDVSPGDMSLAVFPDGLTVPAALVRAFTKLQEVDIEVEDTLYLRLSSPDPKKEDETMYIQVWVEDDELSFCEQQTVGDRKALDARRVYRNFNCISYYIHDKTYHELIFMWEPDFMMKFLTDYFLFLYPDVRSQDIVVSIACVREREDDDFSVVEFFFYPDGTEDSQEKFEEFIATMHAWRDPC